METIERILTKLHIPAPAREIYRDLLLHGSSPARLIAVRLSMARPSVYDQLKILRERGLVGEREKNGKTEFSVHDIHDLERLMEEEKKSLALLQTELNGMREKFTLGRESVEPKIKFITTKEGIIEHMHDMLWDERHTIEVLWPYEEMLRVFGRSALTEFNHKRIRNAIRLQTIWPPKKRGGKDNIWKDADWGVERRIAPSGFAPRMGYAVYDNKVLLISSAAETFGFSVQSADFSDLMRQEFDMLWKMSKGEAAQKKKL